MKEMTINMTMTSVEIAEFCGKEHRNVLADIRNMLTELGLDAAEFSAPQKYGNNNTREVFNLSKELTIALVSGYDVVARHKIVKRWLELEEQHQKQLPQSHIEAVRAYLITLEKVEEQQSQIKQQIETISNQSVVSSDKKVLTNDSEEYFTINRIKTLNTDMVFNGNKLTTKSNELDLPTTQLFAPYNMNVPNTYHRKVWNLVYPKAKLP